jgi:hypothetical protein
VLDVEDHRSLGEERLPVLVCIQLTPAEPA